jgi:hypothetical protein
VYFFTLCLRECLILMPPDRPPIVTKLEPIELIPLIHGIINLGDMTKLKPLNTDPDTHRIPRPKLMKPPLLLTPNTHRLYAITPIIAPNHLQLHRTGQRIPEHEQRRDSDIHDLGAWVLLALHIAVEGAVFGDYVVFVVGQHALALEFEVLEDGAEVREVEQEVGAGEGEVVG